MLTKEEIKSTGATFTPPELADYLSAKLCEYTDTKKADVLDPSCGDGELLLSISQKFLAENIEFTISGYDSNESYLDQARIRLNSIGISTKHLLHSDFLTSFSYNQNPEILDLFPNYDKPDNKYDVVIANPPYVRTQIIGGEQAQIISKKFGLKGRIDLYYPFLIGMTQSLKEGGILAVITSNRYLFTKSGESIREFISKEFEILELIDLGDTKLFDAAVLPAILIARKRANRKNDLAKFTKLYEDNHGFSGEKKVKDSIYAILESRSSGYFAVQNKIYKKTIGSLNYSDSAAVWKMLTNEEAKWIEKVESSSEHRIKDIFKVRVGIKTTADKVFLGENWETYGDCEPEGELLKELISQENITPWNSSRNVKLRVLYPHISIDGKKACIDLSQFPKANRYFLKHKEVLSARKYVIDAGRKWYEIWVAHNPEMWKYPKLVFPDISGSPRFAIDTTGKIVNGNCYWIVATSETEKDNLLLIQGIANSKLMTKYHDLMFNNKLYSGKRRYLTQYVEKYPLPNIYSASAIKIIEIVKKLNTSFPSVDSDLLLQELEICVANAFGVEPVLNLD